MNNEKYLDETENELRGSSDVPKKSKLLEYISKAGSSGPPFILAFDANIFETLPSFINCICFGVLISPPVIVAPSILMPLIVPDWR